MESGAQQRWMIEMFDSEPRSIEGGPSYEPTHRVALRKTYSLVGVARLHSAVHLETASRVIDAFEEPLAGVEHERFVRETLGVPRWPSGAVLAMPFVNLQAIAPREQATVAGRRLARAALELRRARLSGSDYPASLADQPASPFTGEKATYLRLDDGSVEISFPETERAWEELFDGTRPELLGAHQFRGGSQRPPNLRWRLPA